MGNPITDLWHIAVDDWKARIDAYVRAWHIMYNTYNLGDFEQAVRTAITELAQAVEYSTAIIATSDIDTISIVRDGLRGTIENFRHLKWPVLPRYLYTAELYAYQEALRLALRAEAYARGLVNREHAAMERRVLQEELARLVEVADVWARLHTEIAIERYDRTVAVDQLRAQLTALIARTRAELLAYITQQVTQLTRLIDQVRAYAQSIPGLIDLRAVNGYDPTLRDRAAGLTRLLDTAAAHEPLIAGLVADLAKALVDLAEIDDPLIRLAAQFLLKQVIDHVGLDRALGGLLNGILGDLLGHGPPKTLLEVTASAGRRLDGAEAGLAALSPLAQEADDLHEMGTLVFDAALLGYLFGAVADPVAAADDTATALDGVVTPLLAPVRGLLGMP